MNAQILNKYIELIDKGYCEDCNELNCIGNFPQKEIAENIKVILEENQELKKQQKEFIKWLENESKEVIRDAGYHQRICLEILSKYKEIIGVKNE